MISTVFVICLPCLFLVAMTLNWSVTSQFWWRLHRCSLSERVCDSWSLGSSRHCRGHEQ